MKQIYKKTPRTLSLLLLISVLSFSMLAGLFLPKSASAAQITARSLTLQAGATDGGSMPGGVVNHLYNFTVPTTANIGSIKFEYCTLAAGACVTPTNLVTTSATMG